MENHKEENSGRRLAKKPKTAKPKKPSRFTTQQKVLISVAAVLVVAVLGVLAVKSLFVRPDLEGKKPGVSAIGSSDGDGLEEIDYGEGLRPRKDGERKSEDYYTVLILGRDTGGGGNTDTILLASYDVTNQKATVMSIPRDTMVNVPWDVKRINSVYNYYGEGERGIQHLYKEISQLVGFEPDYQVIIEWDAVEEIVDAMGGVWFDVPRDMNYEDYTQDLYIHQTKGYRKLSGSDAMQVIRYRHDNSGAGYADGDLGRIRTQQAFLKAMVEQLLQWKNLTNLYDFITVFQENVETDMPFQTVLWFAQKALAGLSVESVNFVTMPNTVVLVYSPTVSRSIKKNSWQSYVVPNARSLLELVNGDLSPFVEKFTLSDLDIMSKNADGSISSSTGYVEDRTAALPPVLLYSDDGEEIVRDEDGNIIDPETGFIIDPETGWPIDPETGFPIDPETGLPSAPEGGGPAAPGGTEPTPPGVTGPGIGGGTTTAPGGTDPGTTDPSTTDPGTTDPGITDPGIPTPGTADPGVVTEPDPDLPEPNEGSAEPGVTGPGILDGIPVQEPPDPFS